MIDAMSDDVMPLSAAARLVPSTRGGRVNPSTVWRWATRGIRGVRLETVKVGGAAMTSKAALNRFFAKLSDAPVVDDPTPEPVRARRAQAALAARGVKSAMVAMTT